MSEQILLSQINPEDFWTRMKHIVSDTVSEMINKAQPEKLLSQKEACELFSPRISRQTLNAWTKDGRVPVHMIGNRHFYKQSEILSALTTLQKYKR